MSYLQDTLIRAAYSYSIVNKLNAISVENAGGWKYFNDAITDAAKEAMRDQYKTARQPLISNVTIQIISIMKLDCKAILRSIDDSATFAIRVSEKTAKNTGVIRQGNLKVQLSTTTLESVKDALISQSWPKK